MRFSQIDRITAHERGHSLTAVKGLVLNKEYLQDHFPRFPVMPGVLMLESMYQAGVYLVLAEDFFRPSMATLAVANQVKFNNFLEPGKQLEIEVVWKKQVDTMIHLAATGQIDGKPAVKAKLVLDRYSLADRGLAPRETDELLRRKRQQEMLQLVGPHSELRRQTAELMSASQPVGR